MSSSDCHTFLPVVCLSCRSWHTWPSSMCCTVSEDSPWHPNTMTLSQQQLVFLFVCDWCDCTLSSTMYKYTPFQQCKSPSLKKTSWSHDTLTHACEAKWTFLSVSLSSQQTTKFSMKTKSRDCGTYMQWSCKFWWCNGFTVVHAKRNLPKTSREVSEDSSVQKENPRSRFAVAALELREACEELNWSRERSTPRRSHTNRSAERVARRKTEGLHEATECHGYLRNAQELVADGQTRYERRINSPLDALIFPIWSVVEKQSSASNLVLKIFSQSSSVAILAQAISCSDVRGVSPVHKRFWFCLVQVSTTQFCGCPLVGAHIVGFRVVCASCWSCASCPQSCSCRCDRPLNLYPKFLHISHRENGSFEVLSLHTRELPHHCRSWSERTTLHAHDPRRRSIRSWPTVFLSVSQAENLVWPFSLQKKHFTFDMFDVPSFALSLLFPLPFSLP